MRLSFLIFLFLTALCAQAQEPTIQTQQDTTKTKNKKPNPFNTGYYPVGFFEIDLKYIIKFNNFEGIRLGIGGITNEKLSKDVTLGGYIARGFKDRDIKYSVGASTLLDETNNTWLSAYYRNDINEIGSFDYLTDARVYSVFEPRLVNVTQFYKIRTWQTNVQTEFTDKIFGELRVSNSRIDQIENYTFVVDDVSFRNYETSEVTAAIRISPQSKFFTREDGMIEYFDGFPKISAQITQGIRGIAKSDFNYTKLGLKLDYYIKRTNLSSTNFLLEGTYANGNVPLTHLFHAYPNSPTKDAILQRFSVAGRRGFETMFFGEFFSDQLATFQVKHSLRRFHISDRIEPELVFISRHALGTLTNTEQHQGIEFNTLEQVYNEAGFELNKLLFGFGLSGAYRYGAYHLPDFEDNIALKFTFYLKV